MLGLVACFLFLLKRPCIGHPGLGGEQPLWKINDLRGMDGLVGMDCREALVWFQMGFRCGVTRRRARSPLAGFAPGLSDRLVSDQ